MKIGYNLFGMIHLMRWVLALNYRNYKDDNEELVMKSPICQFQNKKRTNNKSYKLQNRFIGGM